MNDSVYFDGDPKTDSTRRHMERVLKGEDVPHRWPWALAALGAGGVWMLWRLGRARVREQEVAVSTQQHESRDQPEDHKDR